VEAHLGAVEVHQSAMEAHYGTQEVHLGTVEAHHEALEAQHRAMVSPWWNYPESSHLIYRYHEKFDTFMHCYHKFATVL
jgi:hypothetical protein